MLVDLDNMLDAMVKQQLNVSHLEKKITSKVIPVKKLNSTFKKVINDEYDSKLLKDADYVIAFYENQVEEKPAAAPATDGSEDEEKEEVETTDTEKETSTEEGGEETEEVETTDTEEATDTEETTEEDPEFGVEDDTEEEVSDEEPVEEEPTEDEEEDDEKKKEQVNENIKIQDLTKSMLSPIKPKTPKSSTPKSSTPKSSTPKSSTPKKDNNKKSTPKKDNKKKCGCECKNLDEAETEATGEELRSKVSKALENTFKSQLNDTNKIELYDIKSTKENCYFAKITLKKRDSQTNDKN